MKIQDDSLNSLSNLFGNNYAVECWGHRRWLAGLCNWRRKCAHGFLGSGTEVVKYGPERFSDDH